MIQALFFDLGRVLLDFDYALPVRHLAVHSRIPEDGMLRVVKAWGSSLNTGQINHQRFYDLLVEDTGLTVDFNEFRAVWAGVLLPHPTVHHLIRRLKPLPRLILSNTDAIHWQKAREFEAPRLFERSVLSFEVEVEKPDPRIYEVALAQFGVPPEGVLYIDDLAENLAPFKRIGGKTAQFNLRTDPVSRLEEILGAHGVLEV